MICPEINIEDTDKQHTVSAHGERKRETSPNKPDIINGVLKAAEA